MSNIWEAHIGEHHSGSYAIGNQEGGAIGEVYNGYLDELLSYENVSWDSQFGYNPQYRKLYFKNVSTKTQYDTRVFFSDLEHTGQLAMCTGGYDQTGTCGPSLPTNLNLTFITPTGYTSGVQLGNISANDYESIWIQQTLTTGEDSFASAKIVIQSHQA